MSITAIRWPIEFCWLAFLPRLPRIPVADPPAFEQLVGYANGMIEPAFGTSTFRLYLQAELARRCAANTQYSLRAFASSLGLDHSTMSQLIRGKRALTPRTIQRIGRQLGLDELTLEAFLDRERLTDRASVATQEIRDLTRDTVSLLTDPTHRAILELTHLPEFVADSRWVARMLNVSVDAVNRAITRLTHLGLLEMVDHERWLDRSGIAVADPDFARAAVRRLAERVRDLDKLGPAIETLHVPPERWTDAQTILSRLRSLSSGSGRRITIDVTQDSNP